MGFEPFKVRSADAQSVVIMMFGGDNNLSPFVVEDMQEMAAGLKPGMAAIVLADLIDKPAMVAEITAGRGIETIEDWGEIDTGDPVVLHRFVTRALLTYPKARKAIGFWDHGTGVFDETDNSEKLLTRSVHSVSRAERSRSFPARRLFFPKSAIEDDIRVRGMLHDETNGGVLTNIEAAAMLRAAFSDAGQVGKIDLLFSDTCLNGMIEVLEELGPFARSFVASPELEPGDGWDYHLWMSRLAGAPTREPIDWGRTAVEAFETWYKPKTKMHPCTLAAFHTEHGMTDAFKGLLDTARAEDANGVFFFLDHARAKSQGYAKRDTYDLRDFAVRVSEICRGPKPAVAEAAQNLIRAFDAARMCSCRLGETVAESEGLAFWFPSSRSTLRRDIGTYRRLAFAQKTGWAAFLEEFR